MIWICAGMLLSTGSVYDIRTMTLPNWLMVAGLIAGGLCSTWLVCTGQILWGERLVALLPAGVWFLLSFGTRGQMGSGDGGILLILGLLLGSKNLMYLCIIALTISFVVSLLLLVTRRANGKTRIPFVPFLFVGYLVVTIQEFW